MKKKAYELASHFKKNTKAAGDSLWKVILFLLFFPPSLLLVRFAFRQIAYSMYSPVWEILLVIKNQMPHKQQKKSIFDGFVCSAKAPSSHSHGFAELFVYLHKARSMDYQVLFWQDLWLY